MNSCDEENLENVNSYGLKTPTEWKCYELTNNPGVFFIPNPFKPGWQRYFIKKCLRDYHNLPNKTNLDLHSKREMKDNIWDQAVKYEFVTYKLLGLLLCMQDLIYKESLILHIIINCVGQL